MDIWVFEKMWIIEMKNIFDDLGILIYRPTPCYILDFDNWYAKQIDK